ncbi:hypothetical protein V6N13_090729 [Hibiscus sabdariffa]|uniref:Uncharacterized protein n=2 Tax=Hibiscus sabdariffa TaxID=183260 RepID=A0ABR2BNN0_9ROSI
MASAGTKVMMIAMVISMMGHEAVVSADDCIKDCSDACGSPWCHLRCEWKCIRSSAASFFGPIKSRRVSPHSLDEGSKPSALPLPPPLSSAPAPPFVQPDGSRKNGMVAVN